MKENDLSAADIAETTLKKLLDDVEKTSEHWHNQKNVSDKRGKADPANKKSGETSYLVNYHILG